MLGEDRAPLPPSIAHLPGAFRYQIFCLYLVLDLFSHFIVGWLIAQKQSGDYAQHLLAASFKRFALQLDQLTIYSDNGGPMTAKPLAWLFSDLGIRQSLSRPHVSIDNPLAEAGFKTLKCHPTHPDRFESLTQRKPECGPWSAGTNTSILTPAWA